MFGWISVLLSGIGLWAFFKYILLVEIHIDANIFKTLYDLCKEDYRIILAEEVIYDSSRHPTYYNALCFFKGAPWFHLNHTQRLMQAGFQSKEGTTTIICLRYSRKKLVNFLRNKLKELHLQNIGIPISLLLPNYTDKIGVLKEEIPYPLTEEAVWEGFEKEVSEITEGRRKKTSAILYGPPGNGKTYLVKYLATKHRLPIVIITLSPDWSNHDLLSLFAHIPNKCIVLLEDFDNYFDKRQCLVGKGYVKFTFDIILNGLDGVYNSHDGVVFIMTVNDIDKVDWALKNRPSRFKYVLPFTPPDFETRIKLLPTKWAEASGGFNLDEIFRLKEYYETGLDLETAIDKLFHDKEQEEQSASTGGCALRHIDANDEANECPEEEEGIVV